MSAISHSFADEIFRVYAKNLPDIALSPIKMEANVEKMVKVPIFHKSIISALVRARFFFEYSFLAEAI